jgi:hypothetical protein
MRISGRSDDLVTLLSSLSPTLLADLVADLLALREHTQIKIVDGPGDGGRDIHSLDTRGRRHVCQCKWHRKIDMSASSAELGELPLAMVKLSYTHGLFATNGRISPQAKREYIDNYPNLSLEYLEGTEIASEVLGNPILKGLWYNGETLARLSSTMSIPMIVRNLREDRPIAPDNFSNQTIVLPGLGHSGTEYPLSCTIRVATCGSEVFDPYRTPVRKTIHEGWWPPFHVVEAQTLGGAALKDVPRVIDALLGVVSSKLTEEQLEVAVRFGAPVMTTLEGLDAGHRIELPKGPLTFVKCGTSWQPEREWLLPSRNSGWAAPKRVSMSQADWVRWYNAQCDLCLNLEVLSPPSTQRRGMAAEQQEYAKRVWSSSTFAFVDGRVLTQLLTAELPAPSEKYRWFDGREFCCWRLNVDYGVRSALIELDESGQPDPWGPFGPNAVDVNTQIAAITAALTRANAEIVPADRARHVYALVAGDPFPELKEVVYQPAEFLYHWNEVPSPVAPTSRRFGFDAVWLLSTSRTREFEATVAAVKNVWRTNKKEFELAEIIYEDRETQATYLLVHLIWSGHTTASTDEVLLLIRPQLEILVKTVAHAVCEVCPHARLATGAFWRDEIGLLFS